MRHQIAYASPITQVDTSRVYALGDTREEYNSTYDQWQTWTYVFNDEEATAFAQGTPVAFDAAKTSGGKGIIAPANCVSVRLIGVAQHAIAAGSYGWILSRGVGEVTADGSASVDTALDISGTAGRATTVSAGVDHSVIFCHEDDAGAGTNVTCSIKCL